jgi:hypothetical protein
MRFQQHAQRPLCTHLGEQDQLARRQRVHEVAQRQQQLQRHVTRHRRAVGGGQALLQARQQRAAHVARQLRLQRAQHLLRAAGEVPAARVQRPLQRDAHPGGLQAGLKVQRSQAVRHDAGQCGCAGQQQRPPAHGHVLIGPQPPALGCLQVPNQLRGL